MFIEGHKHQCKVAADESTPRCITHS